MAAGGTHDNHVVQNVPSGNLPEPLIMPTMTFNDDELLAVQDDDGPLLIPVMNFEHVAKKDERKTDEKSVDYLPLPAMVF